MEQKDDCTIQHEDYIETAPLRETFEDVCDGTAALRAKHAQYLPKFPLEHADDYAARWNAATMLNITDKTVETMCGLALQKGVMLNEDVPEAIKALSENIDNKGNHLDVFARDLFEESFDGWAAVLVDSPEKKAGDLGEQRALGLRPYWRMYKAEDVTNWAYEIDPISKRMRLSLVVFRECFKRPDGRYKRVEVTRYRTFFLENGEVYWRLDEVVKEKDGKETIIEITPDTLMPKLTKIPVAFVGEPGDEPPLMDLAFTNLKHAQKTSDYDTIIHKTCVPIPYTTGVSAADFGKLTQVGSTMYHLPTEGCSMGFAEVQGGSIEKARQDLQDVEVQMATLGLAMLAQTHKPKGDVTATETLISSIKELSGLQARQSQLKDCIEACLGFTAELMNQKDGGSVTLADLSQHTLTPQQIQIISTMVADGTYSLESFTWILERNDLLPEDVTATVELDRITKEMSTITPVRNAANFGGANGTTTTTDPQATTGGNIPNGN